MSLCKTSMQQANNKFVRAPFLLSAALFFLYQPFKRLCSKVEFQRENMNSLRHRRTSPFAAFSHFYSRFAFCKNKPDHSIAVYGTHIEIC